ncbi:hypothetical protein PHLCEN_2v8864 [Hermanssonia centrifuga]|uniref:BTB domain-containing protein n=1 Tax=Hermanssonia centrifuga TaxID=98765 RepID=A0A2R6NSI4_9APHY|nr:hypothetical protein PHLCEN_2v8864 [Hermanssonia centrifuga]
MPARQDSGINSSAPKRHSTLYLHDGDIILSSPNNDNTNVLFRVHRAILTHHSAVFSSILSIPSPPESNEIYEGAPLIQLTEDANDVEALVNALYNPSTIAPKKMDPDLPLRVRGILKLAEKYQIDSVRQLIIQRLEVDWPQNVSEWYLFVAAKERERILRNKSIHSPTIDSMFPEPASAIRLAMEFNIPSILPAAYYMLVQTDPSETWTIATQNSAARWQLLDNTDFVHYIRGRHELATSLTSISESIYGFSDSWSTDGREFCHTGRCDDILAKKSVDLDRGSQENAILPDPLKLLYQAQQKLEESIERERDWSDYQDDDYAPELCYTCNMAVQSNISREMRKIWGRLPQTFGVYLKQSLELSDEDVRASVFFVSNNPDLACSESRTTVAAFVKLGSHFDAD